MSLPSHKHCPRCERTFETTVGFYISKANRIRTPFRAATYCKECTRASTKAWFRANRQRVLDAERARRADKWIGTGPRRFGRHAAIKEFMAALKSNPCMDCGISYPPYCMDLDHVRGQKLFGLSDMHGRAIPDDDLIAEIQKCDLVCSNCHRIRTAKRRQNASRGRSRDPTVDAKQKAA